MADWIYAPRFDSRWDEGPPPTLKTVLADGKAIMRQKHANAPETWDEEYDFDGTEHDAAHTFYKSKYALTAFTKVSYDVAGTPSTERSVRFTSSWSVTRAGQDWFVVRLTFERAY